jgi:hypothetical protein
MNSLQKYCLFGLLLLSYSCGSCRFISSNQKDIPMDIFLFIGQSNMAGVARIGELDTVTLKNVYILNDSNQWEKAKNESRIGFNRYSSVKGKTHRLSISYTFSRKVADYTGRQIGVVHNARGATGITQWQKDYQGEDDYNLYEEAVKRTKIALALNPESKVKGIIWHQGESDNSKPKSDMYMQRLQHLVQDLRTDLGDNNIAFIAGEVGKWKNRGLGVNPVIRQIEANIPYSGWVSSEGLTSLNLEKNDPHFDTFSQRAFGGRYADVALKLIYDLHLGVVELFSDNEFKGRSVTLREGEYSMRDIEAEGIRGEEIHSLKIKPGFEVVFLFTDKNIKSKHLSSDSDHLRLNNLSLIRIRKLYRNL